MILTDVPVEDLRRAMPRGGAYPKRTYQDIHGIVVHHTAGRVDQEPADVAQEHLLRGWPGIGYHLWVRRTGEVAYVTDLREASYGQGGHGAPVPFLRPNLNFLAIVLPGNYEVVEPTPGQLTALRWLVYSLRSKLAIHADMVLGHREFKPTLCPGRHVMPHVHELAGQGLAVRPHVPRNVRQAQQALVRLGYSLGPAGVDGTWGPDTQRALRLATGHDTLHFESAYAVGAAIAAHVAVTEARPS